MTDVIIEGRTFQLGDVVRDHMDVVFIVGIGLSDNEPSTIVVGGHPGIGRISHCVGGDVHKAIVLGNIHEFNCNK